MSENDRVAADGTSRVVNGIEITPEMVQAGAEMIRAYFYDVQAGVTDSLLTLASEVFEEMSRLSAVNETR